MGRMDHYKALYQEGFSRGYLLAKAYADDKPSKKIIRRIFKRSSSVYLKALKDGIEQRQVEVEKACTQKPFLDFMEHVKKNVGKKNDLEIDF